MLVCCDQVYGSSVIVISLPALDPHSLIASLCQKMAITELIDLIYTIRKASSKHCNDSTPEPVTFKCDKEVDQPIKF